jgi:DNA-binding NarL/FixJ family response regulator
MAPDRTNRSGKQQKPLVLLAARPVAREPFRTALGDYAEVVEAETLEEAVALVERQVPGLVCCTVYFDDSRMFDLIRWIRSRNARVPIVCARAVAKDMTKLSMEAVKIAAVAVGATSFIDLVAMMEERGGEAALEALRTLLMNCLSAPPS